MRRGLVGGVIACVLVLFTIRAAAQVSSGSSEITVNSYTDHAQRAPVNCRIGTGEVVIWQSDKQDGRSWGIYGQRYDAIGAKVGSEFRVHSHTSGSESHPAIACAGDGRFIVVWDSDHSDTARGVFGQLFDGQGTALGSELQINADTLSDSVLPAVCSSADGTAVVTWQGYHPTDRHDIFARRISSTGELLGSEWRVNTHVESTQSRPTVGCHPDGEFVVVWDSDVQDGADFGVFGQRYDRDGMPQGFEFQVSSTTIGSQQRPRIAIAPSSEFVVVWESRSQALGSYGIFGQRFSRNGPLGTEFQVGSDSSANATRPAVATDARGDFVVVWSSEDSGGQVRGQRYTSAGSAIGSEFTITNDTESSARNPAVASTTSGDFTVSWQRREAATGDDGIAARRFVVCGNGRLDPGESCDDGNLRDGDCCSATCEFEQAPRLQADEASCPNIGSEALVCSAAESDGGARCDDGNACTSNDVCRYGVCVGSAAVSCDDGNPCTTDSCRPQVGCLNTPNTLPCDDGNICTGPDVCRGGSCRGGAALTCDDGNVCTDDRCDPTRGCVNDANGAPCDDGDACTSGDRCTGGNCRSGSATSCDDGNPCTDDRCDAQGGCSHQPTVAACDDGDPCSSGDACENGTCIGHIPTTCDDANPCTDDLCVAGTGCRHTPNDAACDDENACTGDDHCQSGRCHGVDAVRCSPVDACHGAGTCDPATGQCSSPPLADGTACDDGVTCTVGDQCVGGSCQAGRTGIPFLVKDINDGARGSAPVELTSSNGRVFFRGDDGAHGRELWVSDGSTGATTLVADIRPGAASSGPGAMVAVGQHVFFAATDGNDDRELWISDGTSGGTHRVRDLNREGSGNPTSLVAAGTHVFFVADDGVHGHELWTSDGTDAGTALVKDVRPGQCDEADCEAGIADLTVVDGRVYFSANDGVSGRELWSSDGTSAGTAMIDIRPGPDGSQPAFLTAYKGTLIFAADDGSSGKELWQSRGSASSTQLLVDIRPGECDGRPCSSSPSYLTDTGGSLFFSVASSGHDDGTRQVAARPAAFAGGSELWTSDGTSAGTHRIAAVPGPPYVRRAAQSKLIFAAGSGIRTALWQSDGTGSGTHALATTTATNPEWPIDIDGRVFFSGSDQQRGTELWSSDGTEAGTFLVHDINPRHDGTLSGSSSPASLTAAGDLLFFSADDGQHGRELWALCR